MLIASGKISQDSRICFVNDGSSGNTWQIVYNHSDYRMMSKRAAEGLAEFKEVNLFLRGMVPMLGFKSDKVYYDRLERFAGESKYPF